MISALLLLLLTFLQFLSGLGILVLFNIRLRQALFITLSFMLGIAVFSVIPFLLQLLYIPLTKTNVFVSLILATLALNCRYKSTLTSIQGLRRPAFRIPVYEIPFLALILLLVFISVWRSFYLPPTPRDFTSGVEAIAEYAVREKTMINSLYSVNLESTNNPFKSPYLTSLQIIYKYAGFPFGQLWLSTLFVSFIVFIYHILREHLHTVLTGFLVLAFLAIPEMYGYTYMALYDYSNALFFCLSVYFMVLFFEKKKWNYLWFAALLMGIATYIRSETLVLAGLTAIAILVNRYHQKAPFWKALAAAALFMAPSLIAYFISVPLYINLYLPVQYSIEGQVNNHLTELSPLFTRFKEMNSRIIFSKLGIEYFGYFFFLFLLLFSCDLFFIRRWTPKQSQYLFAILVIYLGYPILGYLLPLLDLYHSTKRGLFKIFPLMIFYATCSPFLTSVSKRLTAWQKKP